MPLTNWFHTNLHHFTIYQPLVTAHVFALHIVKSFKSSQIWLVVLDWLFVRSCFAAISRHLPTYSPAFTNNPHGLAAQFLPPVLTVLNFTYRIAELDFWIFVNYSITACLLKKADWFKVQTESFYVQTEFRFFC